MILPSEKEIMGSWSKRKVTPTVSICCATYNQADYIESALRGFLIQKTKFHFEILIRDDASTDGTALIIREYQMRYPNIIRLRIETENQFLLGIKPAEYFFATSRAKYIAWCDGDDYWTDPRKLQEQVKFLDENEEYVVVGHRVKNFIEATDEMTEADFYKTDGSRGDLMRCGVYAPTSTRLHRHLIKILPGEFKRVIYGDLVINSILGQYGKYKYLKYIQPSVRVVRENSVAAGSSIKVHSENHLITHFWLYKYHLRHERVEIANGHFSKYLLWTEKRLASSVGKKYFREQLITIKNKLSNKELVSLLDGRFLVLYGIPEIFKKMIKRIFL